MMAANRFNTLVMPGARDGVREMAERRGIDVLESTGNNVRRPAAAGQPYMLRWGDYEYVRETLQSALSSATDGFVVRTNARAAKPTRRGQRNGYMYEDHWLFYKLWGRIMYNPRTSDDVFQAEFDRRYGITGMTLFEAYGLASRMAVRLESLVRLSDDSRIVADGMVRLTDTDSLAFISLDDLIASTPADTNFISVSDYIGANAEGRIFTPDQVTPHELADRLERDARRALVLIESIEAVGRPDLEYELGDITAWSYLSLYLAEKIRGAVALHKYRTSGLTNVGELAAQRLAKAAEYWAELIDITEPLYDDVLITRRDSANISYSWTDVQESVTSEAAQPSVAYPTEE
jgi:hypothetical protein